MNLDWEDKTEDPDLPENLSRLPQFLKLNAVSKELLDSICSDYDVSDELKASLAMVIDQPRLPPINSNDNLIVRLAAVLENSSRKDGSCIKQNVEIITRVLYFLVSNGITVEIQDRILYNLDLVVSFATVIEKGPEKIKNLLFVMRFFERNDISKDWLDWIIQDDNRMARLATDIFVSSSDGEIGKYKVVKIMSAELFLERNNVKSGWQDLILKNFELATELGTVLGKLGGGKFSKEGSGVYLQDGENVYLPDSNSIFKAFSYAEPDDIKVVIIGTSPLRNRDLATGLAFSTDCSEEALQSSIGHSIWKVHQSLKIAGILSTDYNYDCSHEEWATNGVLLLNASLTMTEWTEGDEKSRNYIEMHRHCGEWEKFMKRLLKEWIDRRKSDHKVFVMCWGYADRDFNRYADEIWRGALNPVSNGLWVRATSEKLKNLITLHSDHPTWPREPSNTFLYETPQQFQMVNECYPGIFNISSKKPIGTTNFSSHS